MPAFLLDTNVVSELVKGTPNQQVLDWMESRLAAELHLSAVTIGELTRGATRLPDGRRRAGLLGWIEVDLPRQFDGRILPFDHGAGEIWGKLMGDGDRKGRQRSSIDAQIAATAIRFHCVLATRNTRDFQGMAVALVDPWLEP